MFSRIVQHCRKFYTSNDCPFYQEPSKSHQIVCSLNYKHKGYIKSRLLTCHRVINIRHGFLFYNLYDSLCASILLTEVEKASLLHVQCPQPYQNKSKTEIVASWFSEYSCNQFLKKNQSFEFLT